MAIACCHPTRKDTILKVTSVQFVNGLHESVFKAKVETLENATKETLCKCCVDAENVNAENPNAESVFYQVWCTTKVGVNSEKPR